MVRQSSIRSVDHHLASHDIILQYRFPSSRRHTAAVYVGATASDLRLLAAAAEYVHNSMDSQLLGQQVVNSKDTPTLLVHRAMSEKSQLFLDVEKSFYLQCSQHQSRLPKTYLHGEHGT